MSALLDLILTRTPDSGDQGVPLKTNVVVTLNGLDYDETSLIEGLFVEGPDTDQFVGPGLLELRYPDNISQGELDDFLQSPGYLGIVGGVTTVTGIAGDTVVTFNPTLPFAASTKYRINFTGVLDILEIEVSGFVTWSFVTGTGSIEELPATGSVSVLSSSIAESSSPLAPTDPPLAVIQTTPLDHAVEQPTNLQEIVVEFNREIDPTSVTDKVRVRTVPVTDHPQAVTNSQGELAEVLEVEGKKLKIKI